MKPLLIPLVILCASTTLAGPTQIAFETIVTLDKFRITNRSEVASLFRLYLRPSADVTLTVSDPEQMHLADTPPWPGDDRVGWFVNRWHPGRWIEFSGPINPLATLDAEFFEPNTQDRGYIFAPVANGTFTGFTIPEPSSIAMLVVGVLAALVICKRQLTPKVNQ